MPRERGIPLTEMKMVLGRSWERKPARGRNFQGFGAWEATTRLKQEAKEPGPETASGCLPRHPFAWVQSRARAAGTETSKRSGGGFGSLDWRARASGDQGARNLPEAPEKKDREGSRSSPRLSFSKAWGKPALPGGEGDTSFGPRRAPSNLGLPRSQPDQPVAHSEERGAGRRTFREAAASHVPIPGGGSDVFLGQMREEA